MNRIKELLDEKSSRYGWPKNWAKAPYRWCNKLGTEHGEVITTPFSFVETTHALWWNNISQYLLILNLIFLIWILEKFLH